MSEKSQQKNDRNVSAKKTCLEMILPNAAQFSFHPYLNDANYALRGFWANSAVLFAEKAKIYCKNLQKPNGIDRNSEFIVLKRKRGRHK